MTGGANRDLPMDHITRAVELKQAAAGTVTIRSRCAHGRTYTRREGMKRGEATYVDCEVWSYTAAVMHEHKRWRRRGRRIERRRLMESDCRRVRALSKSPSPP
jgi:hypothetical protein